MAAPDRDDRSVLTAEYVLGTLDKAERQQAESLMAADDALRHEVWSWERRFAALGLRLRPRAPAPLVWLGIQRRIATAARGAPGPRPTRAPRLLAAWAALATAASLVLAVALLRELDRPLPPPQVVTQRLEVPVPAVSYVALLQVPDSTMQWAVSATPERAQLVVRAAGDPPAAAAGFDPELWLVTDAGPISLGVMPVSGEARKALSAQLPFGEGGVLAVSLEPKGGSPTGKPTGPVVTTGKVLVAG